MEDLIEDHLAWCEAANFSPNTVAIRKHVLNKAQRDIRPAGLAATDRELARWLARPTSFRDHRPRSANSKATEWDHLTAFYEWAIAAGEIDWSPLSRLRRPKSPSGIPNPLKDEHLARLLREARQPFRLALILAAFAGLRVCEVIQVAPKNADEDSIRIVGKGNKVAEIDTHPRIWQELSLFPGAAGPYIVEAGGRANAKWLSREARKHFHRLGVPVHLHMARHWFVTSVYESEGEAAAQQAARHSSMATTMRYTALRNGQRRRGILALPVLDQIAS